MSVEPTTFKALMGRFASGVTTVTVVDDEGDHGMTASAFTSVSLDPPLVLVCVNRAARMHDKIVKQGTFAINLLDAAQESVSNRFAGWWEEGRSKWADLDLAPGPVSGAAWVGGALANIDCRLHAAHDGGDHTIFVGEVVAARLNDQQRDALRPLVYFAGRYRQLS
jgi:flavin reductase (DIM6/NTAB) family NADH-FMN oxidoreductase RutF